MQNLNAVGFYWTLPVPWLGFTDISQDIDEAAAHSRTIRYQRDRIRRYAKDHGFDLVHESVFMEIAPDRGSQYVHSPLGRVERICTAQEATLLLVDFSEVQGMRSHDIMRHWAEQTRIDVVQLSPDPVSTAEWSFDPAAHFKEWKNRQADWSASKPERDKQTLARIRELQETGAKLPGIARTLAAEGVLTSSGKPWTADNLRKFLKAQTS
ncbi:hypothetical protein [Aliiruegeria lutimaris]|uniref:Uncharacterized protein n=1 Tax=Aliiruegeria lutimaris TaxID=571298 RepID=A0A1G9MGL0_9RHOB|nr:hypothetical protein [Aliiruegeria lutimaris]SDL72795.1 hypothetical protein SAMN04488026_110913 [Aliiruegeria lutimaris]